MKSLKFLFGVLFGAGLLPKAPGTWGSLFFLPIIYFISLHFGSITGISCLVILTSILSLWSAPESVSRFGDDPGQFVMDEAAGQTTAFFLIPFSGYIAYDLSLLTLGFLLFRVFDILKPLGINQLQKLSGSFGILADDILAGVYACIILHCLIFFIF